RQRLRTCALPSRSTLVRVRRGRPNTAAFGEEMAVLTDEPVFVSDIPEPNPRRGDSLEWNTGVRWLLAGCSLGAAVVHFGYASAHFNEYWLYGLFFVVVAWLQLLWAGAIVARPTRWLLIAAALGNEAVVAVWVASRTVGVWVGPNASVKEAVGYPDVLCTVLEAAVAAGAVALLARSRRSASGTRTRRLSRRLVGAALLATAVADAQRAGYEMSTAYVPCIGAHYTNIELAQRFDPSAPSELLYDGTNPTSRIVGLSYLVWHPGGAPDGFAGPNDRWHQHNFNG